MNNPNTPPYGGYPPQYNQMLPPAPAATAGYTPGYGAAAYPIYQAPQPLTASGRAVASMYALGAVALLNLLSIPLFLWENSLVREHGLFMRGDAELPNEAVAWGLGALGLAFLLIAATITSAVIFLMWVHRAYRMLEIHGVAGRKMTAGWAVGWWFIPFANLVKPYEAVKEIFEKSAPRQAAAASYSRPPESAFIVGAWWLTWIVACLATNISNFMDSGSESVEQYLRLNWITIGATVLYILAAILAIIVVRDINGRQRRAFGPNAVAAPPTMVRGS